MLQLSKKRLLEASTIFSVSPMLCFMQAKSCVKPDYMSSQQDINAKMRAILIDWLIEVKKGVDLITLYCSETTCDSNVFTDPLPGALQVRTDG